MRHYIRQPKITEEIMTKLIKNYRNLSMDELSKLLDVSPGTISSWVTSLRKDLKKKGIPQDLIDEKLPNRSSIRGQTQKVFDRVATELFRWELRD